MNSTSSSESAGHSPTAGGRDSNRQQFTSMLVFAICTVFSAVLWAFSGTRTSSGKWFGIATSELLAVIAGIYLARLLVGNQTREEEGIEAPKRVKRSTLALSEGFFIERAKPLNESLRQTQASIAGRKPSAGDTTTGRGLAEDSDGGPTTSEPAFDDKLLQPEYAIGQGLISRDELNNLRNTYLAQSELSLGMIPSMLLIVFGISVSLGLGSGQWWVSALIIIVTVFLFLLAMERRQKYRVELGLLLVSRWDKQISAEKAAKDAKKQATPKTEEDTIRKLLKEELKALHLEVKPLIVEVRQTSEQDPAKKDMPQSKPGDVF